jgi:hypothetical protein
MHNQTSLYATSGVWLCGMQWGTRFGYRLTCKLPRALCTHNSLVSHSTEKLQMPGLVNKHFSLNYCRWLQIIASGSIYWQIYNYMLLALAVPCGHTLLTQFHGASLWFHCRGINEPLVVYLFVWLTVGPFQYFRAQLKTPLASHGQLFFAINLNWWLCDYCNRDLKGFEKS